MHVKSASKSNAIKFICLLVLIFSPFAFGFNGLLCTLSELFERQGHIHNTTHTNHFNNVLCATLIVHNVRTQSHSHSSPFARHYHDHTRSHFVTVGIACVQIKYRTKSSEQSLKAKKTKIDYVTWANKQKVNTGQ